MKINELPSQEYLNECFIYDPESGLLTWKVRPLHHFKDLRSMRKWNTRYSGIAAGRTHDNGHLVVAIQKKIHRSHRIIWKLITGNEPLYQIDHIDRIRNNNKFANLREATHAQNGHNAGIKKNNTSGYKGVSWSKTFNNFEAYITFNSRHIFLGRFDTAEKAYQAYCIAAKEKYKDFAHFE